MTKIYESPDKGKTIREREMLNPSIQQEHTHAKMRVNSSKKRWTLKVEQSYVDGVDDYYVTFPPDLLDAANLKEGDVVEWIDNGDGSFLLKKVDDVPPPTYDDMIAAGYIMTDDGFWIKEG